MPDPLDYLLGGGAAAAGLALAYKGYEDIGDIGERAYGEFARPDGLAERIVECLSFNPTQ